MEPNHNIYMYKECLPLILIGPYLHTDGRGGGCGAISVAMKKTWSSINFYCEKIRKKLYTLPRGKQTVWADIGAASTSSTNILVLRTS